MIPDPNSNLKHVNTTKLTKTEMRVQCSTMNKHNY